MIPQAEHSFLRQAAIFLTILFFFGPGAAAAQTAAGTITGTVRASDTQALMQSLAVGVYPANDAGNRLKVAWTNENGVFSFTGLAAGSYKIRFFSTGAHINYVSGWYKKVVPSPSVAVEAFSEGTVITLTPSAGADLGETKLDPGLTITGQVTKAAEPTVGIAGIYAQAYLDDGTTWVKSSVATIAEGTYTISGLRSGSYKIRFHAYETEYTTAWYSSSAEPTHAVPSSDSASLVAAGTIGIDGQLSTGGSISGKVSKTDGTNTVTVAGALVVVYDSAEPYAFRGFITTGVDGTYTVPGILVPAGGTGSYIVQFYEKFVNNVGSGLTEWYDGPDGDGAYAQNGAVAVAIVEDADGNKSTSGIDAVLDRGPISGKVSYTTGSPVAGVTVKIAVGEMEKTAVTDAKGLYSIPELASSTLYTVLFLKNGVQIGQQASVAAGATGINLQIAPPPPSKAAKLIPIYKRLLLKKRCYIINGVRVCR